MSSGWDARYLLEGQAPEEQARQPLLNFEIASPAFFRTFGIEIVRGRPGIRLKAFIEHSVERFLYVYDFGDDWRHDICIESVGDGEADVDYPAFVDGERRCPPEDVGGVPGFMDFLEAALDPLHVEHNEVVTWYGKPFDPVDLDERWLRLRLATLAARRRGALARHRGAARSDST